MITPFGRRLFAGLAFVLSMLALSGLAMPHAAEAAGVYKSDLTHSKVIFSWNHAGLTTQYGRFLDYDATLEFDPEKVTDSKLTVVIKVDSIDSDVLDLNERLKGPDLFNVAANPDITFISTSVRQTGAKSGQVIGDLTMNGQTRPLTLDVTFTFSGVHPLSPYLEWYKDAVFTAFSARATLLRSDFGLGFGTPLVSDEINILIESELRLQDE